jgi:hypothetical protein
MLPPVTARPRPWPPAGLAGEHGFVDVRVALLQHAVGRNALARAHHQPVAGQHFGQRQVGLAAVRSSTCAVSGRSACSARIAVVVWRLARASSHLPSSTSVITTAEASK